MKNPAKLVLGLALALGAAWGVAVASEGGASSSNQAAPLTQAADEFKELTREWGLRPESPPALQQSHGTKWPWHGRLYENLRNDFLDAIPHQVKQNGETNSPLRRNQFGFNVAGPVLIPHLITNPNNTFFMLSYEGVRERIFRASLHTIPTAAQRLGDFSQTVDEAGDLLPIYDPETTSPNPAFDPSLPVSTSNLQYLRSTFPGNIIPPGRLEAGVQSALSLYPEPNTAIGPFFQNNYFVNAPQNDDADGFIAKLDHPFGDRHRLTGLGTTSSGFLSAAKYFPNYATPTAPDQHFSSWRTEFDYIYTANPKTVNTASLSVASEQVRVGDGSPSPFPRYDLSSYLSMGTAFPTARNARHTLELHDEVLSRKGKHSLRLSAQFDRYQVNSYYPAYPSGDFQFSADITSLPGIIDTGDPFASLLLGQTAYAERTVITAPSYFRNSYSSLGVGDKYEVSQDLTINAGVTFSRRTPRVEKYNRQSAIDPAVLDPSNGYPGALAFAGWGGMSRGLRPANLDVDPSLGIAWTPRGDSKTVARASYSRGHGQIPIYNGQWGTQGFNARQTLVSANTQLSPALDLAAGVPSLPTPLPNLSPTAADNTVADFADLTGREPVYTSAGLSVEREMPFSILISVGANHSVGHDILVGDGAANPNAINPMFLTYGDQLYNEAFRETLQPYPQFKGFELYGLYPAGQYQRDSGFVRLEKRASFGLAFTAYYEFSKQFDDYSGPYGNQDFFNLHNDWARTSWDTPQYFQLSYVYDLPFGSDKALFHFTGWGEALVDGWSISGTAYWNDGTPLGLHPEFNNTGDVFSTLNVNVVPGVDPHVPNPGPSLWYNPAAFDQPPDFTPGDGPRTLSNLLGPSYSSMDLSVGKRLQMGGERALEFTATAINFLNHGNWNYPDPNIGPLDAPNVDAGKIIGSHGGRVVQLGLKFSF
jgi:hypothetical protein